MKRSLVLFTILAFAVLAFAQGASNNAANKVHAVGSTLQVVGPTDEIILLSTDVKTSNVADLLIEFNTECAITVYDTDYINNSQSDSDYYRANLTVWVEIDGNRVPVDPTAATPDDGTVVFCHLEAIQNRYIYSSSYLSYMTSARTQFWCPNHAYYHYQYHNHYASIGTTATFNEYLFEQIRQAHSFKWFTYDVGKGTHTIEVKAVLAETSSLEGAISGFVGKRTLIVEPLNNLN